MVQNKFDVLNTVEEGEILSTNVTQVSTQGQLCDHEVIPGSIQEKEIHSSWADEVEEKELIPGEGPYEDGIQSNTDGDSTKKDSVEESCHGGTNAAEKELNIGESQQEDGEHGKTDGESSKKDSEEVGINTAEKGTSLRQEDSPDKEEVQKQNDHPDHDEHLDVDDTRADEIKGATEGSTSENVQSIEATVVDVISGMMKEQVYVEQDADPPDHASSEKALVISHIDHHQVTFCRKSSPVKDLRDLISHNIDGLEVEEDIRDLHRDYKEENIKQNKDTILKQVDISPNSKSNNKGQKKGKKNAIDKQNSTQGGTKEKCY
ncbi:uncharacterized protein LOC132625488 [Lycium barbarum]|uniref:uncharacterized protein LOC132625488 n=1 Tax=Lycium barbarum TaxID=112863 RepID=UPI00293EC93D|nr:uncharacterized protein LOC132625488 [Lycium barbarum]